MATTPTPSNWLPISSPHSSPRSPRCKHFCNRTDPETGEWLGLSVEASLLVVRSDLPSDYLRPLRITVFFGAPHPLPCRNNYGLNTASRVMRPFPFGLKAARIPP